MYTKVELLQRDLALDVVTQFGNVGRLMCSKAPKLGRGCFRRLYKWAPHGYYHGRVPGGRLQASRVSRTQNSHVNSFVSKINNYY